VSTEEQLDVVSALGTGCMLIASLPIIVLFGAEAMRAYHEYYRRTKRAP